MRSYALTLLALAAVAADVDAGAASPPDGSPGQGSAAAVTLSSVAVRVHKMDAMVAFYSEAFGITFNEVDTGGFRSQFGELAGLIIRFVPIRDAVDFDGFPVHQLGFTVSDVDRVIALARQHGGRQIGEIIREGTRVKAAIRDPDGNSIELYSAP